MRAALVQDVQSVAAGDQDAELVRADRVRPGKATGLSGRRTQPC